MVDPTGMSGAVLGWAVSKLLNEVVIQTKKVVYCKRNSRALLKLLEKIQPLVLIAARDVSTDAQGAVPTDAEGTTVPVSGLGPVEQWLEDLRKLLAKAKDLVSQCKELKGFTLDRLKQQYRLSGKILKMNKQIAEICTIQAPLALLKIEVGTAQGVDKTLEKLGTLSVDVGKVMKEIEESVKTVNKIDFKIDKLTETMGKIVIQTSSSQQKDYYDGSRPVSGTSFGMDRPLAKLRSFLLGEIENANWVGVCGMGGLGKTRLAEVTYNSKDVLDHFPNRFWLTIGQKPSIEGLQQRLGNMLHVDTGSMKPDEAKARLSQALSGKKVLLVLDDVWNDGVDLLNSLDVTSGSDTGSKILVTTRHKKVLDKKHATNSTLMMETLSDDYSLKLFCECAFEGVHNIPPGLGEELVKDIVNECKGLPLALKVIAGALVGQESPGHWRLALKKLQEARTWDEDQDAQLYNRLQLSYDSLGSVELKKCFIYFAAFPEDSDVKSEKLVNLWAGEKLFQADDNADGDMDPLEEGYDFLGELIGRSLIELRGQRWSDSLNRIELTCRIHDVLRDFCLRLISKGLAPELRMNCLFLAGQKLEKFPDKWLIPNPHSIQELGGLSPTSCATHISLNDHLLGALPTELKAPQMEVLFLANSGTYSRRDIMPLAISPGFLESFSGLKVLDLEKTPIISLPKTLGNVTNLIYLNLSGTGLTELPVELENLTKLENLCLRDCKDIEPWPFDISCLEKLSTLDTEGCANIWKPRPSLHIQEDNISPSLCEPLDSLCSLKALQHLSIQGNQEKLPCEFSSLVNLRYLKLSFKNLKKLPPTLYTSNGHQLSKLHYFSLDNSENLSELPSWVGCLPELSYLSLLGCQSLTSLPTLHKLPKLTSLIVSNCDGLRQLPRDFASTGNFLSLKCLIMDGCRGLHEFPPIQEGAFPQLQSLDIGNCSNLQELPIGFTSKGAFPSLRELSMIACQGLHQFLPIEEGAFPQLQSLDITKCSNLEQLPIRFTSKGAFPSLQHLHMTGCEGLHQFPPIEEGAFSQLQYLDIRNCSNLEELSIGFTSKGAFPSLQYLEMNDCKGLHQFPPIQEGAFPQLQSLYIQNCCNLEELPVGFTSKGAFPSLQHLNMPGCRGLHQFPPIEESAFPQLQSLDIANCSNLQELPIRFTSKGVFPGLQHLHMTGCRGLHEFPPIQEGAFPQLQSLNIGNCSNLQELPIGFTSKGAFPSLRDLNMDGCRGLQQFPPIEEGAFPQLQSLYIEDCLNLEELPIGFTIKGAFPSLRQLFMTGCRGLHQFPPIEEGAFPQLESLHIGYCSNLEELPIGFTSKGAFPSLEHLNMEGCRGLHHFPPIEEGAFPQLKWLEIRKCTNLEELSIRFTSTGVFPFLQVFF